MANLQIMNGDQYNLPFRIRRNGIIAPENTIDDIEIIINDLRKRKINNEIIYDSASETWLFPLSQTETYKLSKGAISAQIRVKFTDGFIVGKTLSSMAVKSSLSEVML